VTNLSKFRRASIVAVAGLLAASALFFLYRRWEQSQQNQSAISTDFVMNTVVQKKWF
jgi:hypothetical protein